MERIFCIYCKNVIETLLDEVQICPNCAEILKIPQAELFNGVFILRNEALALQELEHLLEEKILFRGLHEITANEFEVNDDHSITSLKLIFNNMTLLPDLFNEFTHLKELKITSRSLTQLADNFHPPIIKVLSFFSCQFDHFPEQLFNCTTLVSLWLSGTNIIKIPDQIATLNALEILKLNNNKIKTVSSAIEQLHRLTILDLGCNALKTIPPALFSLRDLMILKLHVNYIESVPEEIGTLEKLQIFEIYCNFITSLPPLPASLQYLDVSSNFSLELTENLAEFQNLKLLNVGGNTKVDLEGLKKILKESSLITKLNMLKPDISMLK